MLIHKPRSNIRSRRTVDPLRIAIAKAKGRISRKELADIINDRVAEISHSKSIYSIRFLLTVIKQYTGVDSEAIQEKTRKREIVEARQLAHTLCRLLTNKSLSVIGRAIGGKAHDTVLHSLSTVADLLEFDTDYHNEYMPMFSKYNKNLTDIKKLIKRNK